MAYPQFLIPSGIAGGTGIHEALTGAETPEESAQTQACRSIVRRDVINPLESMHHAESVSIDLKSVGVIRPVINHQKQLIQGLLLTRVLILCGTP